jgi:hypothetical protein
MAKTYFGRLVDKLLRRHSEDEYRRWLLQYGRVVEGRVIDADDENLTSTTIYYCYHISNVRYESSQLLTPEQGVHRAKYFPGAAISVRFDPRAPGRAVVE